MEKKKFSGTKVLYFILALMLIGSFVFFIFGEALSKPENLMEKSTFENFKAEWVWVLEDGTQKTVSVPGQLDVEQGQWAVIKTVISEKQQSTCICVRSMQQDIKVYVGDELRKEYSTLDTQPFGKTSTMTYVFFEVYESDAGKELRIEFMSDSPYSGYIGDMYTGEKFDIQQRLYSYYMPGAIIAALLFIIGMFVVIGSLFAKLVLKKETDLIYLGSAVVIAATWLLVESKIRQFIFPSSTIAMLTGFLLIAILPYPIMAYIDSIQGHRYKKVYNILFIATAVNFVTVVALQVFDILDFFETMTSSHIIILLLIFTITVTIIRDVIKGYANEYREVAIGYASFMAAGVLEVGLTYIVSAKINGIALAIGVVTLLCSAGLKSIRDLVNIEREKQYAIATSESKAKFLANMSHEIRTPINTIIGMNEMILRENHDDAVGEYAYNIKSASDMLLSLINDVLDFSKMEAGKLQIVDNAYSVANTIKDVVIGANIRAKQKNLELKLDIDETIPAVLKGDDVRIKQVLNNLLSNAIKYTNQGTITFTVKGDRMENMFNLVMSVEDTGVGIKKEDIDKLFCSFERLELSKNRYIQGTGLGLNITKQLITMMGGTIDVESEYGCGSKFTVKLNQQIVDDMPMGGIEQARRTVKIEKTTKTDSESEKKELYIPDANILVVDDTKINLTVITQLLKRTGAKLDTASSGNECLEKTKQKKYDLILMDHMMPEPDGVATLHYIREDEGNMNADTPIVVLTANAIAGMKEQYLEEGFADYLSKPVDVNKLEGILEKYLTK